MAATTSDSKAKVIVIAGPTAIGKSSIALDICAQINGEIVSADSVQIYKGCDVGSNKASTEEQAAVPHHLIDCLSPDTRYTAGEFVRDAIAAIEDIHSRGKTPVVVGGTMMYLQWLVHGTPDAPKSDPHTASIAQEMLRPFEQQVDWNGALQLLRDRDASRADEIERNDWYRLSRALEVSMMTADERPTKGQRTKQSDFDFRCFFLTPSDRRTLFHEIDRRCEDMLSKGLLDETASLLSQDLLASDSVAGRAIGYRQAIEYLCRENFQEGDADELEAFITRFCTATRNYATRQIKWFRKDDGFMFVPVHVMTSSSPTPKEETREAKRRRIEWCDRPTAAHAIVEHFRRSPDEFAKELAQPSQAGIRDDTLAQSKLMRTFNSQVTRFGGGSPDFQMLLEKADALGTALRESGVALTHRFPGLIERPPTPTRDQQEAAIEATTEETSTSC